jgi:hypothetical protein
MAPLGTVTSGDLVHRKPDMDEPRLQRHQPEVDYEDGMDLLQEIEQRFLDQVGHKRGSPYIFGLTTKPNQ